MDTGDGLGQNGPVFRRGRERSEEMDPHIVAVYTAGQEVLTAQFDLAGFEGATIAQPERVGGGSGTNPPAASLLITGPDREEGATDESGYDMVLSVQNLNLEEVASTLASKKEDTHNRVYLDLAGFQHISPEVDSFASDVAGRLQVDVPVRLL